MSSLSDAVDHCFDDMKTMVERNELTQDDFDKWMGRRNDVQINEYKEFNEIWQFCCIGCVATGGLMGLGTKLSFFSILGGLTCGGLCVCLLIASSAVTTFVFGRLIAEVIFIAAAATSMVFFFGVGIFRPSTDQQVYWVLWLSLGIGGLALVWRVRELIDRYQRLRLLWEALPKQTPSARSKAHSSTD